MSETGESKSKRKRTTSCCVPGCGIHKKNGISFHHFPTDEVFRKQWEDALKLRRPASKFMRVCSDHFTEVDYFPGSMNTRPHLKRHAVPTRNLPECESVSSQEYLMSLRETMKQVIAQDSPNAKSTKDISTNKEQNETDSNKKQEEQENSLLTNAPSSNNATLKIEHVEIKQEIVESSPEQKDSVSNCANSTPSIKREVAIEIKLEKEDEMSSEEIDDSIDPYQHCEVMIEGSQDAEDNANNFEGNGGENNEQRKKLRIHTQTRTTQTYICPIYGILTNDAKLDAFTGIKTFQVLDEIVQRVAEALGIELSVKRTGLGLRERVLLTLVKLKLGLNYTALEPLFGTSTTRCSLHFRELTKVLFQIVENYSDQDLVRNQLLFVLKHYKMTSESNNVL